MKIITLQILLLFAVTINAQPGGGGGLKIMNVLDYEGKPIAKNDTCLKIQHYILSDKNHKVGHEYSLTEAQKSRYDYSESHQTFIYMPSYIYKKKKKVNTLNQRLVLIYKKDTMTLDFIDIQPENGAGNSYKMEHIQFQSAYFKCYLNPQKSNKTMWNDINFTDKQKNELLKHLATGIDGNTLFYLKTAGILEYLPDPNLENKRLLRERENCKESISGKYCTLCYHNIEIQDKDSTITISVNLNSEMHNSSDSLHFIYFFRFNHRNGLINSEFLLANSVLKKLNSYKIKINDNYFSGQIKMAVMYYNVGISNTYSKYVIHVNHYRKGKLVKSNILDDVNIGTEEPMIRPN